MSEPLDRQAGTPRWAFAAAVVLLVVVIFFVAGLADRLPLNVWRERLREAGTGGVLLFLVAGVAGTSIGLPRQLLAGVGGYAYGIASGLILSLVAAIDGCALTVRERLGIHDCNRVGIAGALPASLQVQLHEDA